jgi:hypothetical protein
MHTQLQERESASPTVTPPIRRGALITAIILLLALAVLVVVMAREWPFNRYAVIQSLQQQAGMSVEIGKFRETYFPRPECIAEAVTFRREGGGQPFISIQKLTIVSSYANLPAHHIDMVRAAGFHLIVDGGTVPENIAQTSSGVSIGQLIADGAEVEFPAQRRGEQSTVFQVPKLVLHQIADGNPLQFEATVRLPHPSAEVDVKGTFGPWRSGHGGDTALSGSYTVRQLELADFNGVEGELAATGKFEGPLQHVKTSGTVDIPNFEVRKSKHRVHLAAEYEATVNGLNGDVNVDAARAHFRNTTIVGAGPISGEPGKPGKTAKVVISSKQARIQDLLWMFVSTDPPDMTGAVVFRAKVKIPPERRPFLEKIGLEGDFGISDAQYPHPETQKNIDVLSARARGEADKVEDTQEKDPSYDPGRVISNLKGHVVLQNAVAQLSDLSFDVPGASAKVHGTYNLENEKVDLQGHMHLEAELSKTTTGVTSVLLKVVQPFMHKSKRHESVVAIKIGGTYRHPTYTVVPRAEK